jgi:hypothetical protein
MKESSIICTYYLSPRYVQKIIFPREEAREVGKTGDV